MRLEHIGIAVKDADSAIDVFERLLGAPPYKSESVESEHVETHFFDVGGVKIELLEATHPDSVVARFVDKRGPGMHHVAFEVEDLEETRATMESRGFRIVGEGSRPGADGKRVFFLHPADTAGVLIEYCETRPGAG